MGLIIIVSRHKGIYHENVYHKATQLMQLVIRDKEIGEKYSDLFHRHNYYNWEQFVSQ